jgi:hypothetical protein
MVSPNLDRRARLRDSESTNAGGNFSVFRHVSTIGFRHTRTRVDVVDGTRANARCEAMARYATLRANARTNARARRARPRRPDATDIHRRIRSHP